MKICVGPGLAKRICDCLFQNIKNSRYNVLRWKNSFWSGKQVSVEVERFLYRLNLAIDCMTNWMKQIESYYLSKQKLYSRPSLINVKVLWWNYFWNRYLGIFTGAERVKDEGWYSKHQEYNTTNYRHWKQNISIAIIEM